MTPWILIPNRDGMRWLHDCLSSLSATVPADMPILLIDNASRDGSRKYVRHEFPRVRVMPLCQNLGFVEAVNLGMLSAMNANADAVLLLNNDTRMLPGWWERFSETASNNPEFGVLSPWQNDFGGNPSRRTVAIVGQPDAPSATAGVIATDWVEGSCMLIRRAVVERIGYLDPLFAPAYFEEMDYCRRARRAGFKVGLASASRIEHHGAGSSDPGPARSRQRVLLERNYLLYHAADPSGNALNPWRELLARPVRHGIKGIRDGQLSRGEWWTAVRQIPRRVGVVLAKHRRDRRGDPCPVLAGRQDTDDYYARCVARLETGGRPEECGDD